MVIWEPSCASPVVGFWGFYQSVTIWDRSTLGTHCTVPCDQQDAGALGSRFPGILGLFPPKFGNPIPLEAFLLEQDALRGQP